MHVLRIRYELSTEKLQYTTAMLHNDILPFFDSYRSIELCIQCNYAILSNLSIMVQHGRSIT